MKQTPQLNVSAGRGDQPAMPGRRLASRNSFSEGGVLSIRVSRQSLDPCFVCPFLRRLFGGQSICIILNRQGSTYRQLVVMLVMLKSRLSIKLVSCSSINIFNNKPLKE